MKSALLLFISLSIFISFSQEVKEYGGIRFTNFQEDHRTVILFDSEDEIVEEVFIPEEGQGVIHELNPGEYCVKVFIKPLKGDVRLDGLESDQIFETEFFESITSNTENKVSLEKITKHLSSREAD